MTRIPVGLIELAYDIVSARGKEIEWKTDSHSWADLANLRIYWFRGRFECNLVITEFGRTLIGPTLYGDPPENETRETVETDSFVKIRDVAEWTNRHGVDLAKLDRIF